MAESPRYGVPNIMQSHKGMLKFLSNDVAVHGQQMYETLLLESTHPLAAIVVVILPDDGIRHVRKQLWLFKLQF